jgi:hypothetical protein
MHYIMSILHNIYTHNAISLRLSFRPCYTTVMKLMIIIGMTITGTFFGWIGALFTHGNWFSLFSLALSTIGCLPGIWLGYKIYNYYF